MGSANNLILIVVTNPLDSMVMLVQKLSKLPAERVIGTGTMLDTARLHAELGMQIPNAYVLGEHGDSSVINWSGFINVKNKTEIEKRVKGAAMEIIKGRFATWDGIAAATNDLARCIAGDERRLLPVSIVQNKTAYSLPRIVGKNGVIKTLDPELSASERALLGKSIKTIQNTYKLTIL